MAVDGITGIDSLLVSALGGRQATPLRSAGLPPENGGVAPSTANTTAAAPAPRVPPQVAEALQQNARQVNEGLRNLIFPTTTPTDNLLSDPRSPFLTALSQTLELDPLQQSAQQVNEALQNLSFVPTEPRNPLLINSLPASLEASGLLDNPDIIQGNAQQVNEALLDLGFPPQEAGASQALASVAQATTAVEAEGGALAAALAGEAIVTPAAEEAAITPVTGTAAEGAAIAPLEAVPVAASFLLPPGLTPATLSLSRFPDRTPYVLAVYQLNDPAPMPRRPEPVSREVPSIPPVAAVRPTGETRLRQLLLRGREGRGAKSVEYGTAIATIGQAENSIRSSIRRVNADMAAHGLPLHFVFTKNENGFALDLYDCSYSEACRVSYDIPIPAANLPGVIANLQHETGIIVDKAL